MATVHQVGGGVLEVRDGDVFFRLDNGGSVRVSVSSSCVEILPINGVGMELCVKNGSPGVRFCASKQVDLESQSYKENLIKYIDIKVYNKYSNYNNKEIDCRKYVSDLERQTRRKELNSLLISRENDELGPCVGGNGNGC